MRVSVVTPSFNQGQFIQRTLNSVATQGIPDIEHIVFDGGSSDETVDVLKRFGNAIQWTSEKDKGQTDAVNKGICATSGEIIGWLNSDDVYYPYAVAHVLQFFENHPDIDVVYGEADYIDLNDYAFQPYPTEPWNFERLKQNCYICQPAAFFRRRVIEQYGLLDENLHFCMDYEYWLRLAKAGARFAHLDQKLAGSRLYAENKTLGSRLKVTEEILNMQKSMFGTVPTSWLWNYAHAATEAKIDREKAPKRFALGVVSVMAMASFRWNKRVSPLMKILSSNLWQRIRNRPDPH
ncbi:glycosyltransferase involved in cell wall biosynthesis [Nitrobacteraceae bacterium AZCC 2161]